MPRIYFLSFVGLFFIGHQAFSEMGIGHGHTAGYVPTGGYGQPGGRGYSSSQPQGYCFDYRSPGCAEAYPGTTPYLWRYIPYTGYRKFSPIGAMYKDWLDFDGYYRLTGRRHRFGRHTF